MAKLRHHKASTKHKPASRRSKRLSSARLLMRRMQPGIARRAVSVARANHTDDARSQPRVGFDFSGLAVFERLFLRTPVRLLRAGNNVLDLLFYDVHAIPATTRRDLLRWSDPDGSRPCGNVNLRDHAVSG